MLCAGRPARLHYFLPASSRAAAASAARGLMAAMGGLPGVFVMVALNAKELGTWLGETVAKWGAAGAAMRKYEAEMAAQAAREKQIAADREAAQAKALQAIQREVAGMQTRREVLLAEEATAQKATDAQAKRADLIERTAKLYRPSDWPRICDAIVRHVIAQRDGAAI